MSIQLEISLSAYSKIERGGTEISLRRLKQISEILKVTVDGIIQFDEQVLIENTKSNFSSLKISPQIDPLIEQMRSEIEFLRSIIHKNTSFEQ